VQQSVLLSQACCCNHFDLIFDSKLLRELPQPFWPDGGLALAASSSPLVELVLVLLPCSVEVTGAITVLLRSSCENQEVLKISSRWSKMCGDCGRRKTTGLSTQSCVLIVGGYNKCTSCLGKKPNVAKAIWAACTIDVAAGQLLGPLVALRVTRRPLD
jgi:hypothetical protein